MHSNLNWRFTGFHLITQFLGEAGTGLYIMLSVQSMFKIYLILTINLFLYYVHEYLSAFMNVQHLCVWCLRGPEEDLVFSETVIKHACEPPCKRYTCFHALCKSSKCSSQQVLIPSSYAILLVTILILIYLNTKKSIRFGGKKSPNFLYHHTNCILTMLFLLVANCYQGKYMANNQLLVWLMLWLCYIIIWALFKLLQTFTQRSH